MKLTHTPYVILVQEFYPPNYLVYKLINSYSYVLNVVNIQKLFKGVQMANT